MIKRTYDSSRHTPNETADKTCSILWIGPESDIPDRLEPHCTAEFGTSDEAIAFLQAHPQIKKIYCQPDVCDVQFLQAIYRHTQDARIMLFLVPKHIDAIGKRMELKTEGGLTLLSVRKDPLQKVGNRLMKRTFDIMLSALLLLTLFPVFTFIAASFIKFQSRGPIWIKRKYLTTDERLIECFAFRTTHIKRLKHLPEATDAQASFPFGKFLERSALNHLPRLVHVLWGTLSFVGPHMYATGQPNPCDIAKATSPVRYWYKPGLLHPFPAHKTSGPQDRLAADIHYLQNWNAGSDLSILLTRLWKAVF